MYFLYLDDSGSVPNVNEKYYVLGGICVFERRIHWIRERLDKLAETIYPDNPNLVEFHASEIYAAKEARWKSLDKKKRVEIIKNVLKSIENEHASTVAFACAVHKDSFKNHDPVLIAFEDLCSRFDMLLNRKYHQENEQHRGMIIFDKTT